MPDAAAPVLMASADARATKPALQLASAEVPAPLPVRAAASSSGNSLGQRSGALPLMLSPIAGTALAAEPSKRMLVDPAHRSAARPAAKLATQTGTGSAPKPAAKPASKLGSKLAMRDHAAAIEGAKVEHE